MKSNFNIGDTIVVKDGSWSFGIVNGEFSTLRSYKNKAPYRVLKNNLNIMKNAEGDKSGTYHEICDLFVVDKYGNFWFTQSRLCKKFVLTHPIVVDGKTMQISDESYQAVKKAIG